MESSMTQQESYEVRRQIFKNVWAAAKNIDERDVDVTNKPKIIKLVCYCNIILKSYNIKLSSLHTQVL